MFVIYGENSKVKAGFPSNATHATCATHARR